LFSDFHKVRWQMAPLPNLEQSQSVGMRASIDAQIAWRCSMFLSFGTGSHSARMRLQLRRRCALVDLALKLNVLAVFAVFLFIAAILLGAF
jgi:hypothetical protein